MSIRDTYAVLVSAIDYIIDKEFSDAAGVPSVDWTAETQRMHSPHEGVAVGLPGDGFAIHKKIWRIIEGERGLK